MNLSPFLSHLQINNKIFPQNYKTTTYGLLFPKEKFLQDKKNMSVFFGYEKNISLYQ